MKIDIYHSTKVHRKYISVPAGTDLTAMKFPENFDKDLLTVSPFKSQHEILPNTPYIALDSDEVIRQIEERGYAIHGSKIETTVTTVNK